MIGWIQPSPQVLVAPQSLEGEMGYKFRRREWVVGHTNFKEDKGRSGDQMRIPHKGSHPIAPLMMDFEQKYIY